LVLGSWNLFEIWCLLFDFSISFSDFFRLNSVSSHYSLLTIHFSLFTTHFSKLTNHNFQKTNNGQLTKFNYD